jgi:hypothetical protein
VFVSTVEARLLETAEHRRLAEPFSGPVQPWRKWGPYVAERAWGTVREDYSPDGDAWKFFTHDLARSKAYRWGEDAIAGLCDRYQLLVLGFAFWNGHDPILKERFFGLTNPQGNHGEDVKEYWFYLDNTPTHSYMKMLYKYPQGPFPYGELVRENARPERFFEYELLDTGIFDTDRYFDIFIEYAKGSPEDIYIRFEAVNRGPEAAPLHIIPQLWFRNTWGWQQPPLPSPEIRQCESTDSMCLVADDSNAEPLANLPSPYSLGQRYFYGPLGGEALFTGNETNAERVSAAHEGIAPDAFTPGVFTKDAFHRCIVNGELSVNPNRTGTKACLHYSATIAPGKSYVLQFRLTNEAAVQPLASGNATMRLRREEADQFYEAVYPSNADPQEREIQRRALAGMLWTKQVYLFDVNRWLEGDSPETPPAVSRRAVRNGHWRHLNSMRILAVPDRWEYPWFAAWDLAFACIPLALVDPEFAKDNLWFLLFEQFQHPNGQIPAYEWDFSDLNPPVHAWACWRVYNIEKKLTGQGDRDFLEKCFHKLLINFAWWVNRVDSQGNNVFEGGFLGMDNITVVDRSGGLPGGTFLEQSDATGWMAFFCLNLMRIALELAHGNPVYELLATKFFEHFMYIGAAMQKMGGRDYQLWDEEDGFFYDVLRYPNGEFSKFRVRSLVGLIPLYAVELLHQEEIETHHNFLAHIEWFIRNRPDLVGHACSVVGTGQNTSYLLSVVNQSQFARVLSRLADPNEFLSPAGLRSLSKYHLDHPFCFGDLRLKYEPAESEQKIKGGNSNWRGPVWFPTTYLLIESLLRFGKAFGPDFAVVPPGETSIVSPHALAETLANRLIALFKPDQHGRRPCYGGTEKFQQDPLWRDYLLFHEYFHGDNGAGLGATHQTGWTGLVANLIAEWRR